MITYRATKGASKMLRIEVTGAKIIVIDQRRLQLEALDKLQSGRKGLPWDAQMYIKKVTQQKIMQDGENGH